MLAKVVINFNNDPVHKSAVLNNLPSKSSATRNFNIHKNKNVIKIKNPYQLPDNLKKSLDKKVWLVATEVVGEEGDPLLVFLDPKAELMV